MRINECRPLASPSRINVYRALASPSLIALSSKDPILTAFQLSWELRRLSFVEREHEFKSTVDSYSLVGWMVISDPVYGGVLFYHQ